MPYTLTTMDQVQTPDFQAIFNTMPGNFLVLKPNPPYFTILAVSDDLLSITNKERKCLVGKNLFEVFPQNPDANTASGPTTLRNSLQSVIQHKKVEQLPTVRYDVPNAEGLFEERFWTANNRPVLDTEGNVLYVLHTTTDITENIQADKKETALRKIEKKYTLFMQAPVAVCIVTGPENIVEFANEEILKYWGKTTDIVGKPLFVSLPEARQLGLAEILDQVRMTGQPMCATEQLKMLVQEGNSTPKYCSFVFQPYYENTGDKHAAGVFCVAHDVTEQVLSRKKIEESEFRYRTLIEEAPIATALYTGKDITIQYANDIMLSYWGKSSSVVGKSFRLALPELESQPFPALLENVYTTGEPYIGVKEKAELMIEGKLQPSYFNFTYKPLRNKEGKVYGIHHVAIDVTKEVLWQQKLEESERQANALALNLAIANKDFKVANGQLTRINSDLDNFIYIASHDLKAPILNIEGLMDALLDELPAGSLEEPEIKHITGMITGSVNRFKHTIEQLTEITKLQKEKSLQPSSVNLANVLEDVQKDLAKAIKTSGAQLEIDISTCPAIEFSEKGLRSIVYNLLSNALKYRAHDRVPLVQVKSSLTPDYQLLTVTDNGLGIETSQQYKLFNMFQRLHSHVEGTGVGLYTVKRIIDNAGGRIEVKSELDKGTEFKLYFPVKP